MRHVWITLLLVGLLLTGAGLAAADEEQDAATPPQQEDAARQAGEIKELVRQLGHEDYRKRKEAYEKLKEIGEPALEELKNALESDDPEVCASAQRLIDELTRPDDGKSGENTPLEPQLRVFPGPGNIKIQIMPGFGGNLQIAKVAILEETEGDTKVRYEFTETPGKGIDVAITKTDKDGNSKSDNKHFESAEDMKKKDEALHKKHLKAMEQGVRVVPRMGSRMRRQNLGVGIEMTLGILEVFVKSKAQAPEGLLKKAEKELFNILRRFDAVERSYANRSLKDSLDMDKWTLRPACDLPGVRVRPADETLKTHLNIKGGLVVSELYEDTAFTQSLKAHDIITEFDGTMVGDVEGLNKAFHRVKLEKKKFKLKVVRRGKEREIIVDWTYDPPARKQAADGEKKSEEPKESTDPGKQNE
jgi:hypothetical protein